jgi:hypothetical protein
MTQQKVNHVSFLLWLPEVWDDITNLTESEADIVLFYFVLVHVLDIPI